MPWRIQQVDRPRPRRASERGLPPELAEALWRQMIGWFIQYEEEKLTVPGSTYAGAAAASRLPSTGGLRRGQAGFLSVPGKDPPKAGG